MTRVIYISKSLANTLKSCKYILFYFATKEHHKNHLATLLLLTTCSNFITLSQTDIQMPPPLSLRLSLHISIIDFIAFGHFACNTTTSTELLIFLLLFILTNYTKTFL